MTNYTTTAKGHKIDVNCWKGTDLNFQIHIDGELFDEGSSLSGVAETEASEANWQAKTTATDIKAGRIRRIDGKWRFIEDAEFKRGNRLRDALDITLRDEWLEGGLPEEATKDSTWSFCGWNAVDSHIRTHGWVILGGDLYAV